MKIYLHEYLTNEYFYTQKFLIYAIVILNYKRGVIKTDESTNDTPWTMGMCSCIFYELYYLMSLLHNMHVPCKYLIVGNIAWN